MGKNKLARWAEMKTFGNVIEPRMEDIKDTPHELRGRWHELIFRNNNPIVLELGCGKGEYSTGMAAKDPGRNHIGVDIKGARIWRGAKTARESELDNVAFLRTRIEFINSFFAEDEVDEVWITFPDPFPRPRDVNRRLSSPSFLNLYRTFIRDNGTVHLKTDNHQLYLYTLGVVTRNRMEVIHSTDDLYSGTPRNDILSIRTHYEKLFLNEGKKINYLSFRLSKSKPVTHEAAEE